MSITKGLDVSSIQGKVPWKRLKALGYEFGFAKCCQGNDGKDPMFESNLTAMKDAGILPAPYHFLYPLPHLDPVKQAEGFWAASQCGSNVGELPPMLDVEWPAPEEWSKWSCTASQIAIFTKACLERMVELYGVHPIVYVYPYFVAQLEAQGADLSFLASYPLCIAEYSKAGSEVLQDAQPKIPAAWKTWTFWQHDGNGGLRLPNGVDSDFMVFNGTLEDLATLAAGKQQPPVFEGGIVHPDMCFE